MPLRWGLQAHGCSRHPWSTWVRGQHLDPRRRTVPSCNSHDLLGGGTARRNSSCARKARASKTAALRGAQLRPRRTTRPPRAGIIVTLRCRARSGSGSAASRSRRRAIASSTTRMLGHRQGGAEAAADAAAEGDPLVGAGLAAEPALGAELERLGVEVLAVVDEEDAHRDRGVGARRRTRRAARAPSPGGR